jgi:hypothetical protein
VPGVGGVYVYPAGTFTMNSGTISGNTAGAGGGVYVNSGTFTMTGGIISGNTASSGVGGVYVYNTATFTKTGGTVYGDLPGNTTHTPDSTANTATSTATATLGKNGHAVLLYRSSGTPSGYFYRNETLNTGDSISTTDLQTNWTKRP